MANKLAEMMQTKAAYEAHHKFTENGADALNSTLDPVLDLFATMGAMRTRPDEDIERLIETAYTADPLLTTKIIFYVRDIRGGQGERRAFRVALKYLANAHPESICPNIQYIGEYGRYDDLYELIDTKLEFQMWHYMKKQFESDMESMLRHGSVSLLAKWIKTPDASSINTRKLGVHTAHMLGYTGKDGVAKFKRNLRKLRKYIKIVEAKMSANAWSEIDYETVPSRAAMIYKDAFKKHDEFRYAQYISDVNDGKKSINTGTLYPYELVEKVLYNRDDSTTETLWKNLPNYIDEGTNCIVMADVSGSMRGRPMATSVGLAIYFAERNSGPFANMFMTFSNQPRLVSIDARKTLADKIEFVMDDVGYDTNVEAAFMAILNMAASCHVKQEELPASLIIISDMEFNQIHTNYNRWDYDNDGMWNTMYDEMKNRFAEAGYTIPNVVFWNVNARDQTFHTDATHAGVQLVSGSSASTFKSLIANIGTTPYEYMLNVLNSERYNPITVEES